MTGETHKDELDDSAREPHAIDNPAGDARPRYDQYAVNDPQALDKEDGDEGEPRVTRAAADV